MKEVTHNGTTYVLSRIRNGVAEIVPADGTLLRVPISELSPTTYRWRGVVPGTIRFSERPRDFLSLLRTRRDIDLGKRLKAKRKAKAGTSEPKPSRSRSPKGMASVQERMNNLPSNIAVLMAQQLAGFMVKKKGKK